MDQHHVLLLPLAGSPVLDVERFTSSCVYFILIHMTLPVHFWVNGKEVGKNFPGLS